jgi:NADPH2:quinone reductase
MDRGAADQAVPLPDGASLELGASLGVPAMTARWCLFADGGEREDRARRGRRERRRPSRSSLRSGRRPVVATASTRKADLTRRVAPSTS